MTNTPQLDRPAGEGGAGETARRLAALMSTLHALEKLAAVWTPYLDVPEREREGVSLVIDGTELTPEEAEEGIKDSSRAVAEIVELIMTANVMADTLEMAQQHGEDVAETGLLFERLSRVFGRLSGLSLEHKPKEKLGRHRALKPPTAPFVFPNEPGHRALTFTMTSKPDDWHMDGERTVLYTPLIDPSRKRQLAVTFEHQAVADPLALIAEMIPVGDGTALKVLLALPALFFEHNPGHAFNEVNEISIPDLMRYMGLAQRKKGGFDHDDQKRIWDAIRFISRLWIPAITAHTKGGVRVITGDGAWHSPVIVLQGIQEGTQGAHLPKAIRYSLGKEFHAYYTGEAGKRTRMLQLSPRIMELHGKNDLNPLRLAVYYASQFRINKQGAKYGQGGVEVKYGHLLEQAGVPLDRPNPRRQFSRVIGWHQELARKGIIGDLHYPELPKGAGLADYLGTLFTVAPPPDGCITPP